MKIKIDQMDKIHEQLYIINQRLNDSNLIMKGALNEQPKDDYSELLKRIAEVEVKISKMWDLLITKSPVTKEDKPSSYAKKYFNRSLIK